MYCTVFLFPRLERKIYPGIDKMAKSHHGGMRLDAEERDKTVYIYIYIYKNNIGIL